MFKSYDSRCENCGLVFNEYIKIKTGSKKPPVAGECPICTSMATHILPGGLKNFKAKNPYDYLDTYRPDDKRIFSGPKVHSK